MPTVEAAVHGADAIVTVTSAENPILRGKWLKSDAYVNAVGAVGPDRREVDEEVMKGTIMVEYAKR
jgi:thiomorpholine-carboxylate dehydrogenase